MKQASQLTQVLSLAQETAARSLWPEDVLFTLYTEDRPNIQTYVSRYFSGATLVNAVGLYQGQTELAKVVYIVGTLADLQKAFDLAGDIREVNGQQSVLLTWQRIEAYSVAAL